MVFNFTHQNWLVLNSCFFNQSWHPVIPLPNYTLSLSPSRFVACACNRLCHVLSLESFVGCTGQCPYYANFMLPCVPPLMIQCFFVMFLSISILISFSAGGSPHLLAFCLIRRLFLVVHMYLF